MKLNEKIYACRRRAGLSQEALAERIGVSRQAISKWETGDASPEISKLPPLAEAFGITVDWLLSEDSLPEEPPVMPLPEPAVEEIKPERSAWPEWVEEMPGFISRAIKRYGWLYGARTAFSGGVMVLFGLFMRMVTNSFFSTTGDMTPFGNSFGGAVWYDGAGNVVPGPNLDAGTLNALGLPSSSFSTGFEPFDLISGFVICIGVLTMVYGIALAVMLHRWGRGGQGKQL